MGILVAGSFVTDFVARTERAPAAGETVTGLSFDTFMGGKGANQAVAARRLGSEVTMVGCVGEDVFGKEFLRLFRSEGIDVRNVKSSACAKTGCSLVTVETSGQNRICMIPGSNLEYSAEELLSVEKEISEANVVVTQCEMRREIVDLLSAVCKRHAVKLILNPAPARSFSDEVFSAVYVLTPNETELGVIVGRELTTQDDYISAGKELIEKGVRNVVVTLGAKGCLWVSREGAKMFSAFKVKAVDTVGAGDSFTGALAAMLDEGADFEKALIFASAVGALAVQKEGAIPSMPKRSEVEAFLAAKPCISILEI